MASFSSWVHKHDNYSNRILIINLFVLYALFMLLYVPFCCYSAYKLASHSHEPYIKVRKTILSHIITSICILFVLQRLITHDIYCIVFSNCFNYNWSSEWLNTQANEATQINMHNVTALFDIFWLLCCLPKIIYIYYEVSHQHAIANEEWWRQINSKLGENIFIKYHNNIYTICCAVGVLFISLSLFICYLFGAIAQISVYGLISIIIIITASVMYHKLPLIEDIFYLKLELKYLICILIPMILFFNLSNVFIYDSLIWHIVDCVLLMSITSIVVYLVNIKPTQMIDNIATKCTNNNTIDESPVINACNRTNSASGSETNTNKKEQVIPKTWSKWISLSTQNFNRFMQTLTAELCVESILFIVEVTQYKRKIIKKINKRHKLDIAHDACRQSISCSSQNHSFSNIVNMQASVQSRTGSNDTVHFGLMTMLPSAVPKSPIVYNSKRLSVQNQMLMIYQKYVNYPYAPLLISISHETRANLDETLNSLLSSSTKYKEHELLAFMLVFEECLQDVYRLLNGSWHRLRKTLEHELTLPVQQIMEQKFKTMQT